MAVVRPLYVKWKGQLESQRRSPPAPALRHGKLCDGEDFNCSLIPAAPDDGLDGSDRSYLSRYRTANRPVYPQQLHPHMERYRHRHRPTYTYVCLCARDNALINTTTLEKTGNQDGGSPYRAGCCQNSDLLKLIDLSRRMENSSDPKSIRGRVIFRTYLIGFRILEKLHSYRVSLILTCNACLDYLLFSKVSAFLIELSPNTFIFVALLSVSCALLTSVETQGEYDVRYACLQTVQRIVGDVQIRRNENTVPWYIQPPDKITAALSSSSRTLPANL
ncbi:hypothetical protein TcasGA2_TC014122 [Tribolium castaneum]|uniref:Uncharacterized protein n=1 Tax=Tribolium castaneum TaxID=7070 RepID=D6WKC3_TRICA|nr:hypothetical protein TcasGA2_TC014122 [Tribolium castaneum]